MLKIRLARGGAKKRPYYYIVVADSHSPRDGKFIERVGTYNPMLPRDGEQKRVTLKTDRIAEWLGKGAQPTDRVARFLSQDEALAGKVKWTQSNNPKKAEPGKKAQERAAERAQREADRAEAEAAAKAEAAEAAQRAKEEAKAAAEATTIAERWMAEARVARDGARFALPPSLSYLGAGDVVSVQAPDGLERYRIDRVEQAGVLQIEAVRVEAGIYEPSEESEEASVPRGFTAAVPVMPVFLDLPLLTGAEDPYAPHLAVIHGQRRPEVHHHNAHPVKRVIEERRAKEGLHHAPGRAGVDLTQVVVQLGVNSNQPDVNDVKDDEEPDANSGDAVEGPGGHPLAATIGRVVSEFLGRSERSSSSRHGQLPSAAAGGSAAPLPLP